MKPKYWNKGKIYLSNKDKVLKNLIKNFPKEHMILNSNYYHALLNSIITFIVIWVTTNIFFEVKR